VKRQSPVLSILIVNWNTRESLARCLRRLPEAVDGLSFQTVVVDNDSVDGSRQMLRDEFPWVNCIHVKRNLGYGAGVNLGVKRTRTPYVLLLNPDVVPRKGAVKTLLRYVKDQPGIDVAGGYLCGEDGRSQMEDYYVPFPTLRSAMLHYTRLSGLAGRLQITPGRFSNKAIRQIPGACLLTTRDVLEAVGPFDEGFFIWFEDVDWCYRTHGSRYGLGVCEEAAFLHEGGRSFETISKETRKKWYYRSMLRFFRKHDGLVPWMALAGLILTEEALVLMISGMLGLIRLPSREIQLSRAKRAAGFISFLVKEMKS
jgi:GT2 family glycosyltransferase